MSDEFDEYEDDDEEQEEATPNRPRGWLAADVKTICDLYITGELQIKDNKPLTPHRMAVAIKQVDGLVTAPSTGAVTAVFKRWEEMGFASFRTEPYAFVDYTEQGRKFGLKRMQELQRARRADARASRKVTAGQPPA